MRGLVLWFPGFSVEECGHKLLNDKYKTKVDLSNSLVKYRYVEESEKETAQERYSDILIRTTNQYVKCLDDAWKWEVACLHSPIFQHFPSLPDLYKRVNSFPFIHSFVEPMEVIVCSEVTD